MARSLIRLIALVGAFLAVAPVAAQAAPCGLPDTTPWWVDFSDGSVSFRDAIFKHPGVIAASTGAQAPASLRQGGAQTIYWDMNLAAIVGTPTAPADPAGIPAAAQTLVQAAVDSSGCGTPFIGLNEMTGQDAKAPFPAATTAYRANLLALTAAIVANGAYPYVFVPNTPYPPNVSDAASAGFWQTLQKSAVIVLENYPQAPKIYAMGPILGSRTLRIGFRTSIAALTGIGVPAARIGLMLGFQSGIGFAGREGLQPTDSWLEIVKLEALAAKQVAADTGIQSVWSWGWGTFNAAGADADKAAAACTYLWTRDPVLCELGTYVDGDLDTDLDEGQITLPEGVQCTIGSTQQGVIPTAAIDRLARLARGRVPALDALEIRYLLRGRVVSQLQIRRAEQAIIYARFGGSRARYVAALARRGATPDVGRAALADGLRLQNVEGGLHVAPPALAAVRAFRKARGGTRVRAVTSSIPLAWLGNATRGIAIPGSDAPPQVLRARAGQRLRIVTAKGVAHVTVGAAVALRSTAAGDANASISSLLRAQARDAAGLTWLAGAAQKALATTSCLRDALPSATPQTIAVRAPFLRPLR